VIAKGLSQLVCEHILKPFGLAGLHVITVFCARIAGNAMSDRSPVQIANSAERAAGVASAPIVIPNDEYFSIQWHLCNTGQSGGKPDADINAPEAWEITTGDPNIIIAVVDSGVYSEHSDLMSNLVPGWDLIENDGQPDPVLDNWEDHHGTWCAGLIAAKGNNSIGATGVTWNCSVMPIRSTDPRTNGPRLWAKDADRAWAFRWAAEHGAAILSHSWNSSLNWPILHSAIVDITRPGGIGRSGKGCLVFFCAGPFGTYPNFGPMNHLAAWPEVIAVGATGDSDVRLEYSGYGPELDIMAPGAPYPSGGQVGGSLQLDGIDDCIITTFGLNPAEGPFSIFAWIKGGACLFRSRVYAGMNIYTGNTKMS
jgi:subtilisin family serine protease